MEYRSARDTVVVLTVYRRVEEARHGLNVGYQRDGCRCEECRQAHREYMVKWRAGRSKESKGE